MTDKQLTQQLQNIVILVDTREKNNTHITDMFDKYDIKWAKQKLNYGDYSAMLTKNVECKIHENIVFDLAIERKNSLTELGANISTNRERFKKEFQRSNSNLILMIEDNSYSDIIRYNYDNKIEPNSYLAMLHSLSVEFNIPFIFMNKDVSFIFIYKTLYYYIRNKLKYNTQNNKIYIDNK